MDRIAKYEEIVTTTFRDYEASWNRSKSSVQSQAIIDTEGKHYQLIRYGWKGDDYIHHCIFHVDIIKDKVWIQENKTDILLAEEFVEAGIEKQDIVLGLLPPPLRKDSAYAAA